MRNLKKILALVLALVMSLSLMATASAAETTAAASDSYATAKEVLEKLEVFRGDEGGMRYDASITRAETAALVYRIATSDVKDTQAGLYTNHPFTDLAPVQAWATGYIAYGYNAEILKGNGDNTFSPNAPVTGYATLAMILRTMGYGRNHEFEGASWEIQTAATARQEGLLNGVTAADEATLGQPASRGLVAQILFNALLKPTVKFNINTPYNYTKDADTLGYQKFRLEEIEGVVTANEYADLYANTTLAANKTRLNVDGVDYVLDETKTTLDDIGESKLAYVRTVGNAPAKTVLVIADSGRNTAKETPDKKTVDALLSEAGLSRNAETENYINFSKDFRWQSDWRIRYEINFLSYSADKAAAEREYENERLNTGWTVSLTNFQSYINNNPVAVTVKVNGVDTPMYRWTYEYAFTPGSVIGSDHQTNIKLIFDKADRFTEVDVNRDGYTYGEVYVGTSSLKDVSDTMSYKQFVETYINQDTEADVSGNEKGNWLKVVDNDADGIADYILKVVYTTAQVEAVKDGAVTLDVAARSTRINDGDEINQLTSQKVVSDDELAVNDVVYYALIDGKAQTYKATPVTAKINSVNRNDRIAIADDETSYEESGVHEHIYNPDYVRDVREMAGGVSYDMYLGRGDYLLAFAKTAATSFTLITDGYYNSSRNGDEYAVKAYIDGKQVNTDVGRNGAMFIDRNAAGVQNNGWNAIRQLGQAANSLNAKGTVLKTTVAGLDADGNLIPVDYSSVYERGDHAMIAFRKQATSAVQEERYTSIVGSSYTTGTAYTTTGMGNAIAYDSAGAEVEIRALSSTIYYFVYRDNRGEIQVAQYNGYANLPSLDAAEMAKIEDIYAAGTLTDRVSTEGTDRTRQYYTANVVVVEFNQPYKQYAEQILVVDDPVVASSIQIDNVKVIRASGAAEEIDIDMTNSWIRTYDKAGRKCVQPGLYNLYPTSTDGLYTIAALEHDDIAGYNFDAGQISTALGTVNYDYAEINSMVWNNTANTYAPGGHNEYKLTANTRYYTLSYTGTGIDAVASLSESTLSAVLDPRVDESELKAKVEFVYDLERDPSSLNGSFYRYGNRNDVLVSYDASGNAVYVVSFANIGTNAANGAGGHVSYSNYAQNVWEFVMPSAIVRTTTDPDGVQLRSGADLTAFVADLNDTAKWTTRVNNTFTTVIPYSAWKDYAGQSAIIYLTPAMNNEIAVDGEKTFTYNSFPVRVPDVLPDAYITTDNTRSITVMSQATGDVTEVYYYSYTFTAPEHDSAFTNVRAGTAITKDTVLNNNGNRYVNLEAFVLAFGTPKGATAVWSFTTEGGENFTITVKNPVDGSPAVTENNAPRDVDILDEVADAFSVTVTAECGEAIHSTTYTQGGVTPPAGDTVTVNFSGLMGGVTFDMALSKELPLNADKTSVTLTVDFLTENGVINPTNPIKYMVANGTEVTAAEVDGSWKLPVAAGTSALTVLVSYDEKTGETGPSNPGFVPPPANSRIRTLSNTDRWYAVYVKEGTRPSAVSVLLPVDKTQFVVGDLARSTVYPNITAPDGYWAVGFPVSAEETLTSADIFVRVTSTVPMENVDPGPDEGELSTIRAIAQNTTDAGTVSSNPYKFYILGKARKLDETEIKNALSAALKADHKLTVAPSAITLSSDGERAYFLLKSGQEETLYLQKTSDPGKYDSYTTPGELFAVTYGGKTLAYVKADEEAELEGLTPGWVVFDDGEATGLAAACIAVDENGKCTLPSTHKGGDLVNVIRVSYDSGVKSVKCQDDTVVALGYVKPGAQLSVVPNGITAGDGERYDLFAREYTYWPTSGYVRGDTYARKSLADVTTKVGDASITVDGLSIEDTFNSTVVFSIERAYEVSVDDAVIGAFPNGAKVPVDGLEEDDVLITRFSTDSENHWWNASTKPSDNTPTNKCPFAVVTKNSGGSLYITLKDYLSDTAFESATGATATGKKIDLYSAVAMDVSGLTSTDVVVKYGSSDTSESFKATDLPKFYVRQGATIVVSYAADAGKTVSVTEGDNDPFIKGTPASTAYTVEIPVGEENITLAEVTGITSLSIHLTNLDGSGGQLEVNDTIANTVWLGNTDGASAGMDTQHVEEGTGYKFTVSSVKTSEDRPEATYQSGGEYIVTITNLAAESGYTLDTLAVDGISFNAGDTGTTKWTAKNFTLEHNGDGTVNITMTIVVPNS